MKISKFPHFASTAILALCALSSAHAEVDADAAKALFKSNDCSKCHAVDKDKKGPSLKKIASKYKGKPDSQAKLIEHFSKGGMVKDAEGNESEHKILDAKDPAAKKNLADWILGQ